jgi:phenylpropionate dioxygenase-like ring-hydroxylating dioxygenase large terminal subunit
MTIYQEYGDIAATLLDHVEQNTTDMAAAVTAIPVKNYLDNDLFQKEKDTIFKRLPLMLALTIELPNANDYKAMEVLDTPVLITRDRDGVAQAFLNVCKHRGMLLAPAGTGNRARFACQYHAWTYANDGNLVGIADPKNFGETDKGCLRLTRLPTQEVAGMIFVILTPDLPIDVPKFLGGMLDDLAELKLETWYFHKARTMEGANWKVAYDGYLEGYHFQAAHTNTVATRTPSNRAHFTGFGPHLRIGFPQHGIAKLRDIPREEWGHHENDGYDFVRVVFPNFSFFKAPEMCQLAQLFPGKTPGTNLTVLNYLLPQKPETDAGMEKFDQMCDFFYNVVLEEDYFLGLKVQRGLESGAMDHITFGRNERGNQYFHKWLDYYMNTDQSGPEPVL